MELNLPSQNNSLISSNHMLSGKGLGSSFAEETGQLKFQSQNKSRRNSNENGHNAGFTSPNPIKIEGLMSDRYTMRDDGVGDQQFDGHAISLDELRNRYSCDFANGLSQSAVEEKQRKTQSQQPPQGKESAKSEKYQAVKSSAFSIEEAIAEKNSMLSGFLFSFNTIIIIAAIIFFIACKQLPMDSSNLLLAILLLLVVLIFQHTGHLDITIGKKITLIFPTKARVIRDGKESEISAASVVQGDLLILPNRAVVPVDCRIIEVKTNVTLDVSMYFESEKIPREIVVACTNISSQLHSRNIALQGTRIVIGEARAIALRSAKESIIGKVSVSSAQLDSDQKTPIRSEIKRFVTYSSQIGVIAAVILVIVSKYSFMQNTMVSFVYGACAIIAFTPKGFITLLSIVKKMSMDRILNNPSTTFTITEKGLEFLSQVTSLTTDVSAIIDRSSRTVHQIWQNRLLEINNQGQSKHAAAVTTSSTPNSYGWNIADCAVLTSVKQQDGGNDLDAALIKHFGDLISDQAKASNIVQNVSANKNKTESITVVSARGTWMVFVKGNADKVFAMCESVQVNGQSIIMNQDTADEFKRQVKDFRLSGHTAVGCAMVQLDNIPSTPFSLFSSTGQPFFTLPKMVLLGVIGVTNPVNVDAARSAVALAQAAGVKTILITQEHVLTAASIAQQAGIISKSARSFIDLEFAARLSQFDDKLIDTVVIDGLRVSQAKSMQSRQSELEVLEWLKKGACVIGNAQSDTLAYVNMLLRSDLQTTAVLVDNVQDSLTSNVDVVITSGELSSSVLSSIGSQVQLRKQQPSQPMMCSLRQITNAIEESRGFEENVKKLFMFVGVSQMAQIIPILVYLIFQIPIAISPMFMLLLSTLMTVIPAIALGREQPEYDTLFKLKVKRAKIEARIITFRTFFISYILLGGLAAAAGYSAFFTTMNQLGFPSKELFGLAKSKVFYPDEHLAEELGYDEEVYSDYLEEVNTIKEQQVVPESTMIDYTMLQWNSIIMTVDGSCVDDVSGLHLKAGPVNWLDMHKAKTDLRKVFVSCDGKDMKWKTVMNWSRCDQMDKHNYSSPQHVTACYRADALNYAQTAYFLAVVFAQFATLLAVKSLTNSFAQTQFNPFLAFSFILQIAVCVIIAEVPGIQTILKSRPVSFWQWGIPAAPFALSILAIEELRKAFVKNTPWFQKVAVI